MNKCNSIIKVSIFGSFLLFILLSQASCSGLHHQTMSESVKLPEAGTPYLDPDSMSRNDIYHLPTGTLLSQSELFALLATPRIVYVGEGHDNIYDHQVELTVIKNLYRQHAGKLVVGFEMLAHVNQEKIDLWAAGKLSDDDFIRLFAADWGVADFIYYQDIFTYLKAHGIPIRALNVSRREKMEFMRGTMVVPDKTEKSRLTDVAIDPYQEKALRAMFKGHAEGHGNLEMFIKVQQLWEKTMAHNISAYLDSPAGAGKFMAVIAGGFHIEHGYGLPRRVFQKTKLNYASVLTYTPAELVENERRVMNVDFPDLPLYLCDYLWCVPYRNLKDKQARLGIGMQQSDRGIEVVMVEPESAAAKYGLRVGDVIVAGDGKVLKNPLDLSIMLLHVTKGDVIELQVERGSEQLKLDIRL